MARFDWATMAATIALGGYEVDAALTDSAAFLALVGLTNLQPEYLWQDYEDFDDVETAIDDAIAQIMNGVSGGGDMIKIAEVVAVEDCASLLLDDFDSGVYRTYKLIIQGMKSDEDVVWIDDLLIQVNEDDANAHYDSFCTYEALTAYSKFEYLTNQPGFYLKWFIATNVSEQAGISHLEILFFDPQGDDYKNVLLRGMAGATNTGKLNLHRLQGTYNNAGPITSVEIFPVIGDNFLVDPDTANAPSELRMTMYGLR